MLAVELPIRKSINAFNVRHFYTRMRGLQTNSELETPQVEFKLWLLTVEKHQPPLVVYDNKGIVKPSRLQYCLVPIEDAKTLNLINGSLPKVLHDKVTEIWTQWPETGNIYFTPVPRLRSAEALRALNLDWVRFLENHVIAFAHKDEEDEHEKDPRLMLIHKCTILKGLDPYLNPNSIQCTQGGTGKSEFYFNTGHNFGKVTANTFLGYAKSPSEIFPGFIDGTELPVGIDQIESQSAQKIMSYMFNALERGTDNVASGGVIFQVRTYSIFNLLANPATPSVKIEAAKSFRYVLYHLSFNAALGRRFGLILYGTDFRKIKRKPSQAELEQWKRNIDLFRAVEEFCEPQLRELIANHEIREWLNREILDYESQIQCQTDIIEDENVRAFITEHASGAQARVRGAALYGSIVDSLDKVALGAIQVPEILERAEDILSDIVRSNIDSIAKIAQNWNSENADYAKMVYRNLPVYLREMLSAIELWRRQYPNCAEILLNSIPYQGKDRTYAYLSKCAGKLSKRTGKGKSQVLDSIRDCFQVDLLEKANGTWLIHYLKSNPCMSIEPLGQLTSPISPNSPFPQCFRDATIDAQPVRKEGETVKMGNRDEDSQQTDNDGSDSSHKQQIMKTNET